MKFTMILIVLLLATVEARASCATMQNLAQEHSNDMARRGSMDHAGFMNRRARCACRECRDGREDAQRGSRNVVVVARPRGKHATAGMQGRGARGRARRLLLDDGDRALN